MIARTYGYVSALKDFPRNTLYMARTTKIKFEVWKSDSGSLRAMLTDLTMEGGIFSPEPNTTHWGDYRRMATAAKSLPDGMRKDFLRWLKENKNSILTLS